MFYYSLHASCCTWELPTLALDLPLIVVMVVMMMAGRIGRLVSSGTSKTKLTISLKESMTTEKEIVVRMMMMTGKTGNLTSSKISKTKHTKSLMESMNTERTMIVDPLTGHQKSWNHLTTYKMMLKTLLTQ